MRVAAGGVLLAHAAATLRPDAEPVELGVRLVAALLGVLLLVGLWTPLAGVLCAVAAAWIAYSIPGSAPFWLLEAALGVALALLGPGAWSLDARLFGWKRVDIGNGGVPLLD